MLWRAAACVLLGCLPGCDPWPGVTGDGGMPPGAARMEDRSGNVGSACDSALKCNVPLQCVETLPGGLCTQACMSDADCSAFGASCVALAGLVCAKNCQTDQMCREGYACISTGTANVCLVAPGQSDW